MRLHASLLAACLAALALSAAPAKAESSCAQTVFAERLPVPLESLAGDGEIDPDHHYGPGAMACRAQPKEHCRRLASREPVTLRTASASCLGAATQGG